MCNFPNEIKSFTDLELIKLVKNNDDKAFKELSERYKDSIIFLINKINKIGLEPDDLRQEATLGLLNAAKSYNASLGVSFSSYAKICIKRKVYNFCKMSNRQKHFPLNNFLSINEDVSEKKSFLNKNSTLLDNLNNPESLLIKQEELFIIKEKMKSYLSELEYNVLCLYLKGYSYRDISKELRIPTKTADNALQRAKKKLKI